MYAMEYTQQRAAPAVIAVAVNLALVYVLSVAIGVVPPPLKLERIQMVDVPTTIKKPEPPEPVRPNLNQTSTDLADLVPNEAPTILLAMETPDFGNNPPSFVVGGGDEIQSSVDVPTAARILKSSEPPYPLISRMRDEEGTVVVKVMITPYGTAGDVQVATSSGFSHLDEAALKAVRSWRFAPAKRGSQAIAAWATVSVKFQLDSHH